MISPIPNPVQESVWIDLALMDFRPDARPHAEPEIEKLAKSMSIKQICSIVLCRKADSASPTAFRYEVVAGVGRVLAARKLQWEKIRADVYENLSEFQKLSMMFAENEDRENASPLYQARVLKEMMDAEQLSQEELAERMGKDQTTVSK